MAVEQRDDDKHGCRPEANGARPTGGPGAGPPPRAQSPGAGAGRPSPAAAGPAPTTRPGTPPLGCSTATGPAGLGPAGTSKTCSSTTQAASAGD
eukprot:8765019-Alexandrium_andersonii.AAC.1